jgi:hypothetical protein
VAPVRPCLTPALALSGVAARPLPPPLAAPRAPAPPRLAPRRAGARACRAAPRRAGLVRAAAADGADASASPAAAPPPPVRLPRHATWEGIPPPPRAIDVELPPLSRGGAEDPYDLVVRFADRKSARVLLHACARAAALAR